MKPGKSVKVVLHTVYYSWYLGNEGKGAGERSGSGRGYFAIATGRTSQGKEEDFSTGCQQLMQIQMEPQNSITL